MCPTIGFRMTAEGTFQREAAVNAVIHTIPNALLIIGCMTMVSSTKILFAVAPNSFPASRGTFGRRFAFPSVLLQNPPAKIVTGRVRKM